MRNTRGQLRAWSYQRHEDERSSGTLIADQLDAIYCRGVRCDCVEQSVSGEVVFINCFH